jgi:preprotein translocase subunit YajC
MAKIKSLNLLLVVVLLLCATFIGGCTATDETDTTSLWMMIIFLVFIFGAFWFLIIRPQRKRQQEQQDLISNLNTGDRVVTIGGIYGQIESLREDSVVLKIESGATIRVARRSIAFKQEEFR